MGWDGIWDGRDWRKSKAKTRETVLVPGRSGVIVQVFLWKDRNPFLQIFDAIDFLFYLKCQRK